MNIKPLSSIAAATLAVALLIPAAHAHEYPFTPKPYTCNIVHSNGKPAADATLIDDFLNLTTNAVTTASYKADKHGQVRLTPRLNSMDMEVQYATSPTGVGFVQVGPSGATTSPFTFTLHPITSLRVHFVDQNRKPLPNLKVSVMGLSRGTGTSTTGITWNYNIPGDWTQTTDIHGCATFKHLPQGFSLTTWSGDDHYSISAVTKPILLSNSPTTPDATIKVNRAAVISGAVLDGATNTPIAGITVEAKGSIDAGTARSDKNGRFIIGQLSPGKYRVAQVVGIESLYFGQAGYHENAIPDWISDPQHVKINTAADATGVTLRLFHGGLITGKVTAIANGAPVAGVQVTATPSGGQTPEVQRDIRSAVTASDGTYSLRISPGNATVTVQSTSKTAHPLPQTQIEIHDGEDKTVNFQINPSTYPFAGAKVATHGIEAYTNSEIEVASVSYTSLLPPDDEPVATTTQSQPRTRPYKRRSHRKD